MGGGDWDKDQNSVNLMPDPALSAENRIYNAKYIKPYEKLIAYNTILFMKSCS